MSRRTERVGEAIREVASAAILFEMKDPRVKNVTVTKAEVTGDLRNAKIFVSIMGEEKEQRLVLAGLNRARGFLQRKIADRLDTRYTPVVEIVVDDSVKKSLEMARILRSVLPPNADQAGADEDEMDDDSEGLEDDLPIDQMNAPPVDTNGSVDTTVAAKSTAVATPAPTLPNNRT